MRRLLPLLAACILLAGCATQKRSDTLTTTLSAYAGAVRWNGLQSAIGFVDPEVLKKNPPTDLDLARYQQVRVTDYDDGNGPVPVGDDEVRQTVRISFVNKHTQVERSVTEQQ
ncbi:MAG TPA: hypothetical protein VFM52_01505, partial [Rhodanobacter sp.]|nr:hypothetical protein [Rhodanobacter sp.]